MANQHGHGGHEDPAGHGGHGGHGGSGFHGMMVVGKETVYLSHLPMFTDPTHAVQAILKATFTAESGNPRSVYADDRERTGTKMYTLRPEKFVLSDLVSPDTGQPPPRRSFRGTIFRGHFERTDPPTPILTDIVVEVKNVVYFRELDLDAQGLPQLGYLLFGKGDELFLAHLITRPPDFDQILSVRVVGHEFTDEELRHGVLLTVPERANSIAERIMEGEQVMAAARLAEDAPETAEIQVQAGIEFYFEEGELRVPDTFDQTEAERSAGF
jgi:hypothetical protein